MKLDTYKSNPTDIMTKNGKNYSEIMQSSVGGGNGNLRNAVLQNSPRKEAKLRNNRFQVGFRKQDSFFLLIFTYNNT